ncbi:MAG TPA: hypothetical protein VJ276_20035 [Thermoanaerobaculia bacterium]|nr:hypothetical protein [Thermoanaerobaculia bacterium]
MTATMTVNDGFFGFGAQATGAPQGTIITEPKTVDQLRQVFLSLSVSGTPPRPFFVSIAEGDYDFGGSEFIIRTRRLTFQANPNSRVVLKNLTLRIDLASIDRVLIRGLVFRSDRRTSSDAIRLRPADDATPTPGTTAKANVRIANCSFDGYKDMAICCRSASTFPQLLATIDHCFFFDSDPGQPNTLPQNAADDVKLPFVDRGAINFGSLETPLQPGEDPTTTNRAQQPNNARVTIAENAFFEVWRRTPRIANGNFGHIFNNVVYRWGFGNNDQPPKHGANTWRGIEIGGGEGVTGGGDNGSALIEANRFIPWKEKKELTDTITLNANTVVDIGVTASKDQPPLMNQPNRFDDPDGNARTVVFPPPTQGFSGFSFIGDTRYTDVGRQKPPVTPAGTADWIAIVQGAGPGEPRERKTPDEKARRRLLKALDPNETSNLSDE